jgi:hypothetical protein
MAQVLEISPETMALLESYARHSGMSVEDYLRSILPTETDLGLAANGSADDFDTDMESFADGTEFVPHIGTYSREEIYAEHD